MNSEWLSILIFSASGLGLICLLFQVAARKSFYDHLILYVLACSLSEFTKRLIYIQTEFNVSFLYYAVLLFPDILFMLVLVRSREYISAKKITVISAVFAALLLHGAAFAGLSAAIVAFKTYAALGLWLAFRDDYYQLSMARLTRFSFVLIAMFLVYGTYGFLQFAFGYFDWEVNWFYVSPTSMKMLEVMNNGEIYRAFSAFSGVQEYSMLLLFITSISMILVKGWQSLVIGVIFLVFLVSSGSKTTLMALLGAVVFFKTGLHRRFGAILIVLSGAIGYVYTRTSAEIFELVMVIRNALPQKVSVMIDPITLLPRISIFTDFFQENRSLRELLIGHGFGASRGNIVFDNSYLMVFYETGILGLVALMLVIRKFFQGVDAARRAPGSRGDQAIADAFAMYMVAALIAMFFSQILAVRTFFIILLAVLRWGTSAVRTSKQELTFETRGGE